MPMTACTGAIYCPLIADADVDTLSLVLYRAATSSLNDVIEFVALGALHTPPATWHVRW
jgi:hypothetical protein